MRTADKILDKIVEIHREYWLASRRYELELEEMEHSNKDIIRMYGKNFAIQWSKPNLAFIADGEKEFYWLSPGKGNECEVIGHVHDKEEKRWMT